MFVQEAKQANSADLDFALVLEITAKLTVQNKGQPRILQSAKANKGESDLRKNKSSKVNKQELMRSCDLLQSSSIASQV
jgi:hypothetical protein